MADIKRLDYFIGQFLIDKDFIAEQLYHLEMRRRHNLALHTGGVADGGLEVTTVPENKKKVSVGAGLALDNQGREIVLLTPQTKDLGNEPANSDIFLTIQYQETKTDPPPNSNDPTLFTRWTEQPIISTTTTLPTDGSIIVLAKVHLDASGNVTTIDQSVRTIAGSKIGSSLQLSSLTVSGNVGIGRTNPEFRLDVSGNARFNLPSGGAPNDFRIIRADNKPGLLIRNNGNIGIGTNSPNEKLQFEDVTTNSNIRISRKAAANDAAGNVPSSLALTIVDGGESGVFIVDERNGANTANNQYVRFDTHEGGGIAQERMRIGPNGNIGIGTKTPDAPLHVAQHVAVGPFAASRGEGIINVTGPLAGFAFVRRDIDSWSEPPDPGSRYVWYNSDGNARLSTDPSRDLLTISTFGELTLERGDLRILKTGPVTNQDFAALSNDTFENESSFKTNIKLIMGAQATNGQLPPYEFLIGHRRFTAVNQILHTDFSKMFGINQNGDLSITGQAFKPTGTSWAVPSDKRLKTKIKALEGALDKLIALRGVSFEWKEPEQWANQTGTQVGLVAQEVEKVFPEWVGIGPDGHKYVAVRGFEALTIESFRELKNEVVKLKEQVSSLQARLKALESGTKSTKTKELPKE